MMCGVFAYVAGDDVPNAGLFSAAVKGAARRGPDAHGWWSIGSGIHKAMGALIPETVRPAPIILGHARLATMGAHGIEGVQPVVTASGHVLVHNGNLTNWKELDPGAVTDSYALATVYEDRRHTMEPAEALDAALQATETVAYVVIVLDADGTLVAARSGLPLYLRKDPSGVYLSSGKLPDGEQLPENLSWNLGNTTRRQE